MKLSTTITTFTFYIYWETEYLLSTRLTRRISVYPGLFEKLISVSLVLVSVSVLETLAITMGKYLNYLQINLPPVTDPVGIIPSIARFVDGDFKMNFYLFFDVLGY